MSLLFNTLSRFVIAFLPRNRHLLISWLQSLSTVILETKKIKSATVSTSVQFSHSVVSDSLRPNGLQHTRPACPSPTSGVYSNSCPLSPWCHPTISSCFPFSFCLQSFPASGSFPMSQLLISGGQSVAYLSDSQARLSAPWQWDHVLCISAFPRSVIVPGK